MQTLWTQPVPNLRRPAPLLPIHPVSKHRKQTGLHRQARVNGLAIFAPRGWGKSRLLGRQICYHDACHHIGTVCIDVVGGTINNALDKIIYLPREKQIEVGERLRYCNMAGEIVSGITYVPAWPMLGRYLRQERLFTTSQRPLELLRKSDRNLATASIQGLNRLQPLLTALGIVLTALGEPLSCGFDLLDGSMASWQNRLTNLAFAVPDARDACLFLMDFLSLPAREREHRAEVLKNKLLLPLKFDPLSAAMFTARDPMIDWDEVAGKGLQVYIDFSGPEPDSVKELKILWVWSSLLEWVKSRGSTRKNPVSIVLDELSFLVRGENVFSDLIAEEFRELVEVRSRNSNLYITAATQDIRSLPEGMQTALLSMGNQLYGAVLDDTTAHFLARRWYRKDPKLIKDWRIQRTVERGRDGHIMQVVEIGRDPIYYPLEEQDYMNSRHFSDLKKGEWLLAESVGEGEQAVALRKITTNYLDRGMYDTDNSDNIQRLKQYLMARDGTPVVELLPRKSDQEPVLDPDTAALLTALRNGHSSHAPVVSALEQQVEGQQLLSGNGHKEQGSGDTPHTTIPSVPERTERDAPGPFDGWDTA